MNDIHTLDLRLQRDLRFATTEDSGSTIVWPLLGDPLAFDLVGLSLLNCFESSVTPREVAADLVAAVGMGESEANSTMYGFASTMMRTGHLYRSDFGPRTFLSNYPPSASP